ncbi:hypothetical protein EZV62_015157 [Acer yangbiense]|uniref:Thg1 C-terminal domain-containing protein n=1 Tax=Acer yangbiense TaxID=1000413 RepID=A0A5C7HUX0_9ROSI|nr:hypothetical protein EZV62_015157 [Acer yangbiense]
MVIVMKTVSFSRRRLSFTRGEPAKYSLSLYHSSHLCMSQSGKSFSPKKELRYSPSFHARAICCASIEVLQAYLAWRQNDCHINNQYETCLGMLVKCGKTESEAQEILKGTQKQEKNELLFQQFGINYKKLPELFRQGSCVFKTEVISPPYHVKICRPFLYHKCFVLVSGRFHRISISLSKWIHDIF